MTSYANPDAAKERRNTVLTEMYEDKNISKKSTSKLKQLMYPMDFFHLRRKLAMSHT